MKTFNSISLLGYLKKFINTRYIIFLIILIIFYLKGLFYLDPDIGWRVKAGEYYWRSGIPKTDIFSYTMPDFPWVDHAWIISLIFYLVYNFLGYPSLTFLMTVLLLATLVFASKSISKLNFEKIIFDKISVFLSNKHFIPFTVNLYFKKISPFSFFPFVLLISIFLPFFGVRAQIISWFMFSVLVYWLRDGKLFGKIKYFLPVFFLVWANLHGSFALGVFTLFLYLICKFIAARKIIAKDIFIGFSSFIVSFINPYGSGVWREAWSSASDAKLRWSIVEWMPSLTMFDLSMVFLICLSLILIFRYRRNYSSFELVLFIFLFVQAVSSKRQLPLWAIFTLPLTAKGIFYFWNDLKSIKEAGVRFIQTYKIAWIIALFTFAVQMFFSFKDIYTFKPDKFYPISAVNYLNQNLPNGEIFSDYGWGGYLILNLPQKKVFVDGRMPSWRRDSQTDENLVSAFDSYNAIFKAETDYKEIFNRFGIDTVLSPKVAEKEDSRIYRKLKNFMTAFGWKDKDFSLLDDLEKNGWRIVYQDDTAVIYRKD